MKFSLIFCLILLLSCGDNKEYLIQVPTQTRITSEWILTELEEKAKEDPDNDWLLNQQLYFCEQMEWPLRCERVLLRAKERLGLSEKLIDQFVTFHLKHENYPQLERILKGALETRPRLEARVIIGLNKTPPDVTLLNRYLDRFTDDQARLLAIDGYLLTKDTTAAIRWIEEMLLANPTEERLTPYYRLFAAQSKYETAISLLEMLHATESNNPTYAFDLATYYYQVDRKQEAFALLRKTGSTDGFALMHTWFKSNNQIDSALFYLNKVSDLSTNRSLLISKAELLENKGRISQALPVFEAVLAMDTTDVEMRQRVEIVRRKVASLRQNREKKDNPPPPTVERKTLGN